jgi:hypothetical protein
MKKLIDGGAIRTKGAKGDEVLLGIGGQPTLGPGSD